MLAPANFRYLAPGKTGLKATIHLETRSKRGISEKNLTLSTGSGFYKVDMTGPTGTNFGLICSLEKPFTITMRVHYNDIAVDFDVEFVPSSGTAGTASYNLTEEDFMG